MQIIDQIADFHPELTRWRRGDGARRTVRAFPGRGGVRHAQPAEAELDFRATFPTLVNDAAEARFAGDVAAALVGDDQVDRDGPLIMASEDFSFMLNACPGAYLMIGNGGSHEGACEVHNPGYDFNDEILPLGASFFARLVETRLAA